MKILVTGGAGFIGRHLVSSFLKDGHSVTIFDNFSNSTRDSLSHLANINMNVVEGDIRNKEEIIKAIRGQDIVIHLAAKISVRESIQNPQETMSVNVDGTMNVLEECKKNKIKNTILVSSAAVYGDTNSPNIILSEESDTNPLSPYGKSKLIMEQKTDKFAVENKMNCIIFRIFNIYGSGQSDEYSGVITKFARNILSDKSLMIYGDGLQTRDFISIEDVVSIFCSALTIFEKYGRIYNIGSGKSISIKELANLMLNISNKKLPIEFLESNRGEIRFSQASIERAKKELNFVPKILLQDGLKEFLQAMNKSNST